MEAHHASRTAVLVCQGRAVAHGRIAPGRFEDPTALQMLTETEREPVERARSGERPRGGGDRFEFEMLRATAELMVPRTVAIDDACRARQTSQLVILGAGLDGRAWRMTQLGEVDVFEVDHPSSQDDKRTRIESLAPVAHAVHFAPVDFARGDLDSALNSAGHDESKSTTWVWEGVVPYLTPPAVEATVRIVDRRSALGSRFIVNYQTPSWSAAFGRLFARAMTRIARLEDPLAHEPRRSAWTPASMRALLEGHRFTVVADDDLHSIAQAEGFPETHRRSLHTGRIAVADK
ncbi:MAG: class I SAM-dependent methyltransferase [Ilumatobacteraceae bacterium]